MLATGILTDEQAQLFLQPLSFEKVADALSTRVDNTLGGAPTETICVGDPEKNSMVCIKLTPVILSSESFLQIDMLKALGINAEEGETWIASHLTWFLPEQDLDQFELGRIKACLYERLYRKILELRTQRGIKKAWFMVPKHQCHALEEVFPFTKHIKFKNEEEDYVASLLPVCSCTADTVFQKSTDYALHQLKMFFQLSSVMSGKF